MSTRKAKTYQIRFILRRDLEYVCEFDNSQTEADLIELLKRSDTAGLVAESNEMIVGYCIYSFNHDTIRLKAINVKPEKRRQGVASALVAKLATRLQATLFAPAAYKKFVVHIPEDNLIALNFFKHHGFVSKLVRKKFGDLDGIKMTLTGD